MNTAKRIQRLSRPGDLISHTCPDGTRIDAWVAGAEYAPVFNLKVNGESIELPENDEITCRSTARALAILHHTL